MTQKLRDDAHAFNECANVTLRKSNHFYNHQNEGSVCHDLERKLSGSERQ